MIWLWCIGLVQNLGVTWEGLVCASVLGRYWTVFCCLSIMLPWFKMVKGGAHDHCVNVYLHNYTAYMNPALSRSFVVQCFKHSNTIMIWSVSHKPRFSVPHFVLQLLSPGGAAKARYTHRYGKQLSIRSRIQSSILECIKLQRVATFQSQRTCFRQIQSMAGSPWIKSLGKLEALKDFSSEHSV